MFESILSMFDSKIIYKSFIFPSMEGENTHSRVREEENKLINVLLSLCWELEDNLF